MKSKNKIRESHSVSANREALVGILKMSSMLWRLSDRFFSQFGTTDTQFNILMILKGAVAAGVSQQELSEKLVVTKSNVVGLLDRMEKQGLVERRDHPTDRRYYRIVMTRKGRELLEKVESPYQKEVDRIMSGLTNAEKKGMIQSISKVRDSLKKYEEGNYA